MNTNNEDQIPNETPIENEFPLNNTPPQAFSDPVAVGVKENKKRNNFSRKNFSAGIVALSLSLALIAGAIGGASAGYLVGQRNTAVSNSNSASFAAGDSAQQATSIASTTAQSINSIYETYKSAVVGVRNDGTSTNVFGQSTASASSGTGFIISDDGYILTNNHVIEGADKVTVTLYNDTTYTATIVGADTENDIALLKIAATGLNTVKLGDSDNLVVGEAIFAIGNPLGELTYTVTAGIVSAENREINENGIPINMFQTDVAINPGNSGGPVFNMNGEVIGISTAKYAASSIEGIGFAIPINDAVKVADQIKETGHAATRPYMGVSVTDADSQSDIEGAYVAAVDSDGGSAKAGMKQGDIITAFGETKIKSSSDLLLALKAQKAGDSISVTVYRNGQFIKLTVTLSENKPNV